MSFVNLHVHSHYSLLDGGCCPVAYAERAAELGQPAVAITDHGSLSGAFQHYKACKAVGIKPIIGCEFYVAPSSRTSKAPTFWGGIDQRRDDVSGAGKYTHLTVLADGVEGLRNLYRLHEQSYRDGFYGKPRVDFESLSSCANGLLVLSGCAGSAISTRLRLGQYVEARQLASDYAEFFPSRFWIETMDHGMEWEFELNKQLYQLAEEFNLPVVATNDSHYCMPDDAYGHEAFLAVQTRAKLSQEKRFKFDGEGYYLASRHDLEMRGNPFLPEWLEESLKIADMVDSYDDVFERKVRFPGIDFKPFDTDAEMLWVEARQGLNRVKGDYDAEYNDRLESELKTITELGFTGYFLTLQKVLDEGKKIGIRFGAARGSAGGSLVAYALDITGMDPLEHGLLFERFLNESRVSLPDIDIDVPEDKLEQFRQLVVDMFGDEYVARIGTNGVFGAKQALHDAGYVLGYSRSVTTQLAKYLPPPLFGKAPSLDQLTYSGDKYSDIIDLAYFFEGLVKTQSQHAGGILISPVPLRDHLPLWRAKGEGMNITGFDMHEVDALGFVKFDFLGLRTLKVVEDVWASVGSQV